LGMGVEDNQEPFRDHFSSQVFSRQLADAIGADDGDIVQVVYFCFDNVFNSFIGDEDIHSAQAGVHLVL